MPIFTQLNLPTPVQEYVGLTLVNPASFRGDRATQEACLYLAVSDENNLCNLYRINLFDRSTVKVTQTPLPFRKVLGLSYDPLYDQIVLIDEDNPNTVFYIDYDTGLLVNEVFYNYGLSSVIPTNSTYKFSKETGFGLTYYNLNKPLSQINFNNPSEMETLRSNILYYSYYSFGSIFFPSENNYSFLTSSSPLTNENILVFKTTKSNMVKKDIFNPIATDLTNLKSIYRAVNNQIYVLDRTTLRTKKQIEAGELPISAFVLYNNNFYVINPNSDIIYTYPITQDKRLDKLITYAEDYRVKPNSNTVFFSNVSDSQYNPLKDISTAARILVSRNPASIETGCNLNQTSPLILNLIPDNALVRDPFTFENLQDLNFVGNSFALIIEPGEDTILQDNMLVLEPQNLEDPNLGVTLALENYFTAELIGTSFDTQQRVFSFWSPQSEEDYLQFTFDQIEQVQYIKLSLTKENNDELLIYDNNDNLIYKTSDILGLLQSLEIKDFINNTEIPTSFIKIKCGLNTKIYDVNIKTSVLQNLGTFKETDKLTNLQGTSSFVYEAFADTGFELIKIAAHNKVLDIETTSVLDNTLVESDLINLEIANRKVSSSITLNLKNPQTSFSYATMRLVEPPGPRPADLITGTIQYPDIPVSVNANIIDSGSYINSITTSNNLVWILSRGGNASIISTNPSSEELDFIVSPRQQPIGAKSINITITAPQNYSLTNGTQLDFGPGIVINSIKFLEKDKTGRERLVANITISDITSSGTRDITISSGSNRPITLNNRFEVLSQKLVAVSPVNYVAETALNPRFKTLFINSASLTGSLSYGPFIYIVDDKGYLTRSTKDFDIEKQKITNVGIVSILLSNDNLFIGTQQGAFYKLNGVQSFDRFNPSLTLLQSIPRPLVGSIIKGNYIVAIGKMSRHLDIIDTNTGVRTTTSDLVPNDITNIFIKDDNIFISDNFGSLYEINLAGQVETSIFIPGSDRVVGIEIINNQYYIATEKCNIYKFENGILEKYHSYTDVGGFLTMSKYFNTLQIGTEYGRYITLEVS